MTQKNSTVQNTNTLEEKYNHTLAENEQLRERVKELELLNSINLSLSNTLDRDETLESIRQFFQTTFSLDQYSLMLRTGTAGELEIVSAFGKSFENNHWIDLNEEDGVFPTVINKRQPLYIPNCKKNKKYNCPTAFHLLKGALVSLPLKLPPDHVIGILNLNRQRCDSFSQQEITRLSHLANHVALVIDKTLLFHHTKLLSITDPLTGVYNRRYFDERYSREVTRAIRYNRALSILMIDIDHFKKYNDTLGHLMGDVALKRVASTLENKLRRADILARYGGEEFVVMLPEIQRDNAYIVAEKLRAAIENEKFEGQEKLPSKNVTVSIGIATMPEDTQLTEELVKLADVALYSAKEAGRNRIHHVGGDR